MNLDAIAKIAGVKLCESYNRQFGRQYLSVMPTNLYGIGDNYHPENSHVLPALIRKAHEAKMRGEERFFAWGSGKPRREFLFCDDLADACVFLLEQSSDVISVMGGRIPPTVNIGVGEDLPIRELAELVRKVVGFTGGIEWDSSMPDGTPHKLLDVSRLRALGWKPRNGLEDGVRITYADFLRRYE